MVSRLVGGANGSCCQEGALRMWRRRLALHLHDFSRGRTAHSYRERIFASTKLDGTSAYVPPSALIPTYNLHYPMPTPPDLPITPNLQT